MIGADSMRNHCKPEREAFEAAFRVSGAEPKSSAMLEDSLKNLRTAKALGMTTILITGETSREEHVSRSGTRKISGLTAVQHDKEDNCRMQKAT